MRRPASDSLPFNVVAITAERATARAITELSAMGAFRASAYRRVILGQVEGSASERLVDVWKSEPAAFEHIVRLTPLERVAEFEREDITEQLCCELQNAGPRTAGCSFHVRARLRGLSGKVEASAVERALGGYLIDLAHAAGAPARVSFKDPDLVLAIEVVGNKAGYGFLDRRVREVAVVRPR